eukprot:8057890-Ditylum_brightwellii.AAC.1
MGTVYPTFEHTKGHQDKKKNYDDLPLPAKMNVDADMLAAEFQAQNVVSTTTAIRFPVNVVQLHIKEVAVNSKYFSTLKDTATEGSPLK